MDRGSSVITKYTKQNPSGVCAAAGKTNFISNYG